MQSAPFEARGRQRQSRAKEPPRTPNVDPANRTGVVPQHVRLYRPSPLMQRENCQEPHDPSINALVRGEGVRNDPFEKRFNVSHGDTRFTPQMPSYAALEVNAVRKLQQGCCFGHGTLQGGSSGHLEINVCQPGPSTEMRHIREVPHTGDSPPPKPMLTESLELNRRRAP